jgi:enoyl-CoA hydratase
MSAPAEGRIDVRLQERTGGPVAWVTIDNAARLNSMGRELMGEFRAAVEALSRDEGLRAIVVTGAGDRAFIGGADIRQMAAIETPDEARAFISGLHACCQAVREAPVPMIARLQGYCFGAGLELAAACDLRIAAQGAQFGMPEVRLGIPSVIEAALLPALIGWGRTRRLLFTGETIGADQALSWGLVEEVAPPEALDAAVNACLDAILACGPTAIRQQKALIGAWERLPLGEAIAAGIDTFAEAYRSDEPARMMAAFLAAQAARKAGRG